jgi:hypothetical protein
LPPKNAFKDGFGQWMQRIIELGGETGKERREKRAMKLADNIRFTITFVRSEKNYTAEKN